MIIRLYKKDDPNVLGTINTSGRTPSATGVGEQLLDAWVAANKDVPKVDATRQLESYFASWKNAERYSQVEDKADTGKEK
jgi:hypothetical protein